MKADIIKLIAAGCNAQNFQGDARWLLADAVIKEASARF